MLFWLYLYMFTFEPQGAPSVIKSQTMGREHLDRLGERFIRHSTLHALLLQQSFDTQSGRLNSPPQHREDLTFHKSKR